MTLRAGEPAPVDGFTVVEARPEKDKVPGRYEVTRTLPDGHRVNFAATTEEKVITAAESWLAVQRGRKDGGALARSRQPIRVGVGRAPAAPTPTIAPTPTTPDDETTVAA